MFDIVTDTLIDSLRLLPFLFATYLLMEYMEHKMSGKSKIMVKKSGRFGPVLGGIIGIFPQCGFSASGSGLYAGRVITLGTLMAVFLSTSDEMLPVMISSGMNPGLIAKILISKVLVAVISGILIDLICNKKYGKKQENHEIASMCEHEQCHCREGVLKSALHHTIQIFFFLLVISFFLNLIIFYIGEEFLSNLIFNKPVLGHVISGLAGMIPNCASSVLITRLYLEGVMSLGTMLSGLLAGTGVGLLVLYRVNNNVKENIRISVLLFAIGVFFGILIDFIGIR